MFGGEADDFGNRRHSREIVVPKDVVVRVVDRHALKKRPLMRDVIPAAKDLIRQSVSF